MPSRDDLRKYTCPVCGKDFYVENKDSPSHCPFCMSILSLNPEYLTAYQCSITGATFTLIEANEISHCGVLGGRKQACVDCKNIIEK